MRCQPRQQQPQRAPRFTAATLDNGGSCFELHCATLHCTVQHCTAQHCTVHCTALYNTVLCNAALCKTVPHYSAQYSAAAEDSRCHTSAQLPGNWGALQRAEGAGGAFINRSTSARKDVLIFQKLPCPPTSTVGLFSIIF